jgi:hypothetical protein
VVVLSVRGGRVGPRCSGPSAGAFGPKGMANETPSPTDRVTKTIALACSIRTNTFVTARYLNGIFTARPYNIFFEIARFECCVNHESKKSSCIKNEVGGSNLWQTIRP